MSLAPKLALLAALIAGPGLAADSCSPDEVWFRGPSGKARFTVEIADDAAERAVGLMNRNRMAASHGMLFVYNRPGEVSFWMENTLIPLDMIFIRADGVGLG